MTLWKKVRTSTPLQVQEYLKKQTLRATIQQFRKWEVHIKGPFKSFAF